MKIYIISSIFLFTLHTSGLAQTKFADSSLLEFKAREYVLNSNIIESELKELIFSSANEPKHHFYDDYKLFNMYVRKDNSSLLIKLILNNSPYKGKGLLGYFVLNDYNIFVHGSIPDFLQPTQSYQTFYYNASMEDLCNIWVISVPFWILIYKDFQLRKIYDPIVIDNYYKEAARFHKLYRDTYD